MSVGFVTEAGSSVVNYIQTGASAVFPEGPALFFLNEAIHMHW